MPFMSLIPTTPLRKDNLASRLTTIFTINKDINVPVFLFQFFQSLDYFSDAHVFYSRSSRSINSFQSI